MDLIGEDGGDRAVAFNRSYILKLLIRTLQPRLSRSLSLLCSCCSGRTSYPPKHCSPDQTSSNWVVMIEQPALHFPNHPQPWHDAIRIVQSMRFRIRFDAACSRNGYTLACVSILQYGMSSSLLTIRESYADGDFVGEEGRLVDWHGPIGLWRLYVALRAVAV